MFVSPTDAAMPLPVRHDVTSSRLPFPSVMAVRVRVRVPPGASQEPLPAQLLPCRIQHDGPAPVAAFLRVQPGPGGELWASFRGRRLGGRELPLPPGYRGVVLRGGPAGETPLGQPGDLQAGEVTVTGSFGAITDWGVDSAPLPGRGLARALQWGPLAQALHAPVTNDSEEEAEP